MSPYDINMLRAKLRRSLENIGKSNGHSCPPTKSNSDPVLHELFVAAEAMAFFKTRHDKARDEAMALALDNGQLEEAMTRVTRNLQGESILGAQGNVYAMTIDIAKPALRLDQTALRNALVTKHGMTRQQVDKLFVSCSDYASPAKRVKVVGR